MFMLKMVYLVIMYIATASTEPWEKRTIELKDRLTKIIQFEKHKENQSEEKKKSSEIITFTKKIITGVSEEEERKKGKENTWRSNGLKYFKPDETH